MIIKNYYDSNYVTVKCDNKGYGKSVISRQELPKDFDKSKYIKLPIIRK